MISHTRCHSTSRAIVFIVGLVTGAIAPYLFSSASVVSVAAPANTSFPDTENYWGQPFIQALAERNIVTGYLDNTYRPEQPVKRDEFAAILQKAFSQPSERQIASGSVYKDIPAGYWAASAIHDAYEMGFMQGYPGGEFRPNQPVTRVEVLTSLARNLNLPATTATTTQSVVATPAPPPQQPITRRRAKRPLMFPLAMTTLMQPLMVTPATATAAVSPPTATSARPAASGDASQQPVALELSDYYQDAAQIPRYAVDSVAKTTAAGIVVNHPDRRVLNPIQPASRGEVAALIHQSLVQQGKINPLPNNETAANYIVNR